MPRLTNFTDDARLTFDALKDHATSLTTPIVRLGVTGLSRAGKTIFITALLDHMINGGRLPLFEPLTSGRITRAYLAPQPDDLVPRFPYETHLERLTQDHLWPESTHSISEMRLTVEYESDSLLSRLSGGGRVHIDIVDYPGEWLLDLPLMSMSYQDWCRTADTQARDETRRDLSAEWLKAVEAIDPMAPANEALAGRLAEIFTHYLIACRQDKHALSYLPPGRFLMPGDLAGSPALTFTPLMGLEGQYADHRSMAALMERRFEAYKKQVIRPFFRDHFVRLDRQIVLVDVLNALNAGPGAVVDLEQSLQDVLTCFRPGRTSWLSRFLNHRIERILFAATKADHLHQVDHDRLAGLLKRLVSRAVERAQINGAGVDVTALASIRATREALVQTNGGEKLPAIIGTPLAGETMEGQTFDGIREIAVFPGDLPDDPETVFHVTDQKSPQSNVSVGAEQTETSLDDLAGTLRFLRFRPVKPACEPDGTPGRFPHIRLDKALQFLLGDTFQ